MNYLKQEGTNNFCISWTTERARASITGKEEHAFLHQLY